MLKGIPKLLSPELLKILCEMGHGDELVIADGNFPGANLAKRLIRLDGHKGVDVLQAIVQVFPLDTYADCNVMLMEKVKGDACATPIWDEYRKILTKMEDKNVKLQFLERFAFYERAKTTYAIVATGENALYANIILKKGVI